MWCSMIHVYIWCSIWCICDVSLLLSFFPCFWKFPVVYSIEYLFVWWLDAFLLNFKWSDVFNNKTTSQLSQTCIRCSARERHMRSSRPCTSFALFSLFIYMPREASWAELDPIHVGAEIIKLFPLVGGRLRTTRIGWYAPPRHDAGLQPFLPFIFLCN
jgi:hypothetical protein